MVVNKRENNFLSKILRELSELAVYKYLEVYKSLINFLSLYKKKGSKTSLSFYCVRNYLFFMLYLPLPFYKILIL